MACTLQAALLVSVGAFGTLGGTLACAGRPSPPADTSGASSVSSASGVTSASASSTGSAPAAASASAAPLLAEPAVLVATPGAPACRYDLSAHLSRHSRNPSLDQPGATFPLSFAAGRPPFATVLTADKGELTIGVGAASGGVFLRAEYEDLAVGGVVEPTGLLLYAQRAFAIRGIFVPKPATRLELRSGAPGLVTLGYGSPKDAYLTMTSGALEEARPCGDLAFAVTAFDPKGLLPKKVLRRMYLANDAPLAATEQDAPIAELGYADDDEVKVVAQTAKLAQIVAERGDGWVVGWVPLSALAAKPPPFPRVGSMRGLPAGRGYLRTILAPHTPKRVCDHDVPLFAYQGTEGRVVGALRAGRTIWLPNPLVAGQYELKLQESGLGTESGTSFRVAERDLRTCVEP